MVVKLKDLKMLPPDHKIFKFLMLFAKYFHIFIIQPKIKISAQLSFQNITLISGALRAQQCAPIDIFFYFCLYFRPNASKCFFNFSNLCCLLKCFGNRIKSTLFEFFGFCSLVLCETVKNGTLKIL